jgi:hypothetical protein
MGKNQDPGSGINIPDKHRDNVLETALVQLLSYGLAKIDKIPPIYSFAEKIQTRIHTCQV